MMRKTIIYSTLFGLCVLMTSSAWYGEYELLWGYRQEHPAWCVPACMQTLFTHRSERQCAYATNYGERLGNLSPTLNCCDKPLWSGDPLEDPVEMFSNWADNCFDGVHSADFYNFVSYYTPLQYIGNLGSALKYTPDRRYPFFGILSSGHCVLVIGFDPDLSFAQDGDNFIFYWDPELNASNCIVFNSRSTEIEAWGFTEFF